MRLIVCLDEKRGMAFNRRRQSRDRVLTEDMVRTVGDARLFVVPYSASLFAEQMPNLIISEDPMRDATNRDYCFLELSSPASSENISELILYHWNRHYPSDTPFLLDMTDFSLVSTTDFIGFSHEKITKEVWKK
ncbi:MAG: ribonuclease Z [Clostridia bacterium]|nr:ribonuclease Z [Clostridia bacterium]